MIPMAWFISTAFTIFSFNITLLLPCGGQCTGGMLSVKTWCTGNSFRLQFIPTNLVIFFQEVLLLIVTILQFFESTGNRHWLQYLHNTTLPESMHIPIHIKIKVLPTAMMEAVHG